MACLALACGVLAAALGALCRPRGPNAGLCGPTAPVGHLCKRGAAAGLTLAGWKGADAPRRARRARTSTRRCGQRSFPLSPLRRAPRWTPRGFANVVALGSTASRAQLRGDARRAEQLLQKEVELARCDRLQLCCCITLPLLRTFPLDAQRHDSR